MGKTGRLTEHGAKAVCGELEGCQFGVILQLVCSLYIIICKLYYHKSNWTYQIHSTKLYSMV